MNGKRCSRDGTPKGVTVPTEQQTVAHLPSTRSPCRKVSTGRQRSYPRWRPSGGKEMGLTRMTEPTRFLALAGRVLIGLIFLWSGVAKMLSFGSTTALIAKAGLPFPDLAWLVSVVLEAGCGVLFIIGFQVRPAAVALAVFCLITAFAFHSDFSNFLQLTNFIKNILIVGGLLNIAAFGAGPLSLDNRRARPEGRAIA